MDLIFGRGSLYTTNKLTTAMLVIILTIRAE